MTGDLSGEHRIVPVYGRASGDPDGIMQAIAHGDGTVILHLICEDSRTRVRLDVCRAAQLSTSIWEAAETAQQLTGHFGNDQPHYHSHPTDRGACRTPGAHTPTKVHHSEIAPLGIGTSCPRRTRVRRTIGLNIRRIRKARDKSLRVILGLAGMSASTLHCIEHGQRELTLSETVALASALEIAPAKLIRLPILTPTHR